MAADPTLADRLDERAEPGHLPIIGYSFAADLRAAAVRLRKLDAIDPDELRAIGDRLRELDPYWREAEERKQLLYALADALGGTEP